MSGYYDTAVLGLTDHVPTAWTGAAETAADLGLRVCVIERNRAGGDCLWTGCVPSKAVPVSVRLAVLRPLTLLGGADLATWPRGHVM